MKELLDADEITVNGKPGTIGRCCLCGRRLSRSHLNKRGVRCYYEGAQYDRDGKLLFDARTELLFRAAAKAEIAITVSNDAEHDALVKLIEAAKELCAQ